ncbi:MAG: acetoin dehydrogenase [Myxococcaceae bacterium]|nr:acetoin dehydrogenase [Myxococcaceae bacterium]
MKVSEIMTDLVVTVPPDASAEIARSVMKSARLHHLLVMEGKQLIGVLSEKDLGLADDAVARSRTVADLMTTGYVYAEPDMPVRRAANLLRSHDLGSLPVIDGNRVVGVVTVSDVLELVGRSEMFGKAQRRFAHGRAPREKTRGPAAGRA